MACMAASRLAMWRCIAALCARCPPVGVATTRQHLTPPSPPHASSVSPSSILCLSLHHVAPAGAQRGCAVPTKVACDKSGGAQQKRQRQHDLACTVGKCWVPHLVIWHPATHWAQQAVRPSKAFASWHHDHVASSCCSATSVRVAEVHGREGSVCVRFAAGDAPASNADVEAAAGVQGVARIACCANARCCSKTRALLQRCS